MSLILKKIILEDFKGKHELTVPIGKRTMVSGQNGSGKTTLYDAHLWTFIDRDSSLRGNPDIRPDDGRECVVKVTEEWEIDGVPVEIAKMQKKKVTEVKGGGQPKVSLTNSYEINGVSKTERDFRKDLTERGFNFDVFLPLSHIDVFTGQKAAEMRSILFGMTNQKTDAEIADMTEGCADVADLLRKYKMDEITAIHKASVKKAEDQCKAIPNQIIGLEKAKVEANTGELESLKTSVSADIEILEEEYRKPYGNGDYEKTSVLISDLRKKKQEIEMAEAGSLLKKRMDARTRKLDLQMRERALSDNMRTITANIALTKKAIQQREAEIKNAREEYERVSAEEFDESKLHEIEAEQLSSDRLVCPTCGQDFPKEKQDEIISGFEEGKARRIKQEEERRVKFYIEQDARLTEITGRGNRINEELADYRKKEDELEKKSDSYKLDISETMLAIKNVDAELSTIPETADLSQNQEYQDVLKKIQELNEKIQSMEDPKTFKIQIEAKLKTLRSQLEEINAELAKADNNSRIDEQIQELKEDIKRYAQNKADSMKILDELAKVSRMKNKLLQSDINSHFDGVRFVLFDYLKNGEYKETCIPYVLDKKSGEWRRIGSTANTALEIYGKVQIVNGLQNFYGQHLPIFIDFSAELDEQTKNDIKSEGQIIFLQVSAGDLRVEEI